MQRTVGVQKESCPSKGQESKLLLMHKIERKVAPIQMSRGGKFQDHSCTEGWKLTHRNWSKLKEKMRFDKTERMVGT